MEWPILLNGTTETWRKGRRLLDRSLRPGEMTSYWQMMLDKTHEFLAQLCENPKEFRSHVEMSVVRPPYIV
jgi:cytochrome P450